MLKDDSHIMMCKDKMETRRSRKIQIISPPQKKQKTQKTYWMEFINLHLRRRTFT